MSKYVAQKLDGMKKKMGVRMDKQKMQSQMAKKKMGTSDGYMK
ncbi:MAG: hypothetical protein WAV09_01620 [Minisyncoccia bacterium]